MEKALDLQEATFIVKDFLHSEFGIKKMPTIKMNNRLGRSTLGQFVEAENRRKKSTIELATKIESWDFCTKHSLLQANISTLLHECIHYALYQKELPYDDGNVRFELELKQRGIHSNYTRDELKNKWKRKSNVTQLLEQCDSCFVKDFKKHYETIILEQRK